MPVIPETKTIMLAMSGGVDSAVSAMLLRDAGHTVRCVYFLMSEAHFDGIAAAERAAASLGLPLEVVDLRARFREQVILPFCERYCDGVTPNPCVLCNPSVKFQTLCEAADRAGCSHIATGHYARVEIRGGISILRKAACLERDQSYMLYSLLPEQTARLILPLGELTKHQVRALAQSHGLPAATAPDSQEICFIPDGDYAAFIHAAGFTGNAGRFIAPDGRILGPHRGVEHYTIGQRRGLEVSLGQPVFVRSILPNGDIQLCFSGGEFASAVEISSCKVNSLYSACFDETSLDVKLRSMARPAPCRVERAGLDRCMIHFAQPQRAPAPGQAAVLYDGEYIAGGGVIERVIF